ncbi:MAG: hypothetical protein HY703_05070, partial [Gemmatimonadetes bacterium]|nr:hypothetical protein [Gemmatimonadota bacterium]
MRQFAARSWRPELEASARAARVRAVDAGWLAGAALFAAGCGVLRESRVDRLWAPPAAEEVPALRAHLNRSPSDLHAVFRLASAYHSAARLEESRRLLELLLRRDPADAGATFLLGLTYEDLGLYPEARSLYERYIASADSERLARELRRRLPVIERLELRSAARSALAREPELIGAPPDPRTVAVFPFLYADVDPLLRPLGRAVSEVLAADLARASGLTVVRPERVQSLLAEMGLAARGRIDQAAGARAARLLGAELAVQGWITGGSERLTLSASIQGVGGRDAAVTQFSATSVPAQTLDLEKQLALSVFRRLGVDLSAPEWERVLNLATRDFGALLAFGRGTEALDAGDYAEAARALRRAAELDPAFELAGERARLAAEAAAAAATSTRQLSFAYWLEAGAA